MTFIQSPHQTKCPGGAQLSLSYSMFKHKAVAKEIKSHIHQAFPKLPLFPLITFKDVHACGPPSTNF